MKQMILITVLLIGNVRPEFIPGCSFYNGQCSYTVQLGHQGQCNLPTTAQHPSDFPTTVQPPTTCCTNLQTDIADLRSLVAGLTNDLKLLKDNYNVLENETNELNTTTSNKDDLLQLLQTKEAEFNKTHDQIAAVLQQASAEIHRLRDELVATTRQLNNCRGTLGLQSGTATIAPVLDASINMTFCDFQTSSESCGFNTNRKTGYSWKSHSGSINSLTGPIEDHTYGSQKGVYMYMDTDNSPYGDHVIRTYRMESNLISPAAAVCVRFWYNMNGKDIRTLNIYAKIGNGDGYPVWTQSGNQGQRWSLGEVSLDSEYTASHFKIVVEGTTDSYHTSYNHYNEHGDIAFDDLYIYNTSCNNVPVCPPRSVKPETDNTTSCYTFHVTPTTWYDAAKICRGEGVHSSLVSVTSQEEQMFLTNHINGDAALKSAGVYGYYTSGNDERSEGHFDWTDTGTPYMSTYTDWHTGQPNNVADNQDCLLLQYSDANFEWGDIDCLTKHPFICETRLPISQ